MKLWLLLMVCVCLAIPLCAAQAAGAGQGNNLATKQGRSNALWQAIQECDTDETEGISQKMPLSELETFIIKYFHTPMNQLQRSAFLWLRFDERWKKSGKENVVGLLYQEANELARQEREQDQQAHDSLDKQLIGKSEEEQRKILDQIVRDSLTR